MDRKDFFQIGEVKKLHGFKGEILILFYDDLQKEIKKSRFLFVEISNKLVPFFVEKIETRGTDQAVVKFEGVDDERSAKKILHKAIYFPAKELSDHLIAKNADVLLIGFNVIDEKIGELGEIRDVYRMSMHQVAEITYKNKELLLPVNEQTIIKVDKENKTVYSRMPDGLLDL